MQGIPVISPQIFGFSGNIRQFCQRYDVRFVSCRVSQVIDRVDETYVKDIYVKHIYEKKSKGRF